MSERKPNQLELPFDVGARPAPVRGGISSKPALGPLVAPVPAAAPVRSGLRVIQGGGQKKIEPLDSRDAVARVLIEAGADLLMRKISSARAEEIERRVEHVLNLFDRVDGKPNLMPTLEKELAELEALMRETRALRKAHAR